MKEGPEALFWKHIEGRLPRSVAHLLVLNTGARTGCADNIFSVSDIRFQERSALYIFYAKCG